MPARHSGIRLRPLVITAAGVLAAATLVAQAPIIVQNPKPPVFRAGTTLVPVDVRVLDRDGRPVTDLTAADFTVTENGVPQRVEFFSAQALTPADPEPGVSVRPTTAVSGDLAPRNRRLFLIYMGRGRLQEPSKGVDATLRFVRERLMPQDQVALMAWNRATDFTPDKARIVRVLEKFKTAHEGIEHELRLYFTGLFGLYGGRTVPARIQKMIDTVFDDPAAGTREVLQAGTLRAAEDDARRAVNDALARSDIESFRLFGFSDIRMTDGMFDPTLNMTFDQYIVLNRQTMQDVGNLYAGIDYLRFIEGEKHLVFVTEHGFYLPRAEYDSDLAKVASDARVALDTVHTGGVAASQGADGVVSVSGGFALRALREISDISGGQSSVSRMANDAYDRILNATRFSYLLGYTSTTPETTRRRTRAIKVTVNRRNVTVAHRRSYDVTSDSRTFDPRESLARTRLYSAVNTGWPVDDLKFTTRILSTREGSADVLNIELSIATDRLRMARRGDRHVAALSFAVLAGDSNQKDVGQLWETKDVLVPESRLAEINKSGLPVTLKLPVTARATFVKVVVYDYGSDLMGSIVHRMR